jgi:glyoxylase-like metal-dependent hydrolase (beta-lactamase superfamily II)
MGDLKFELKFFGKCHSNSDILIYVPELKILFTGDLLFKYGRASINDQQMEDKDTWHNAIQWIETRIPEIETIIGGHGEILTLDDLKNFCKTISAK